MLHAEREAYGMQTTSLTLLEQLRQPANETAWNRFVQLYAPLLYYWARRTGLQEADAGDLVQEVLHLLVKKLPEFEHDGRHSFRAWLRTVTLNKWRDQQRAKKRPPETLDSSDEPAAPDDAERFWTDEYHRLLAARALEIMQMHFEPATWRACWLTVVEDRSATDVAAELRMSINAVYLARSRVLARLRLELQGLLD